MKLIHNETTITLTRLIT